MDRQLVAVLEELERRSRIASAHKTIYNDLFPKQKAVADSKARKIAILTSRRAGKSYLICSLMAIRCLKNSGSRCLYIALTRDNVKRIAWETLQEIDKLYDLNIIFNKVSLIAVFPNGSTIECGGAKGTLEDAERYLGAKFDFIAVDESGSFSFPLLRYLLDSVLIPTLMDARPEGKLFLVGTPRTVMRGIFYDATTRDMVGWERFHWNTAENPHMREQYLEEIRDLKAANPEIEKDPIYQREMEGKWTADKTELVYRFDPNINIIDSLPPNTINTFAYVCGMDIGFNDPCAFVVGCYRKNDPNFYVIDCFKKAGMLPDAMAAQLKSYIDKYPNIYIVADTGGSGAKTITQELAYRYEIPVTAAQKTSKEEWVGLINSDFIAGKIKILDRTCESLIEEMLELTWKDKPSGGREENPALANHETDSLLYAYRQAFHYKEQWKKEGPEVGSKEFWEKEEERMFNDVLKKTSGRKEAQRKRKF